MPFFPSKMMSLRNRYAFYISICLIFVFSSIYYRREIPELSHTITEKIHDNIAPPTPQPPPEAASSTKHTLIYKPQPTAKALPIVDNFPLAAAARSAKDLPHIPPWNQPPSKHVPENTPLFIGFTRNWRILQQVVVSYITAGWPPEDIYVVENTGVMDSNEKGRLSLQNPFFLNHTRLHMLGVKVLVTPTLFTFAQLQNFYLWHSIQSNWEHYYWSHMDVVALSFEDQYFASHEKAGTTILPPEDPNHDYSDYPSLYKNCLKALRDVTTPDPETGKVIRWAMRFFSYDRLALVNVASFVEVGGWDTLIPFYATDCDMHARLEMAKFNIEEKPGGMVFDVASSFDDLLVLYRKKNTPDASFTDPNVVEKELQEAAAAKALAEEIERNKTLADASSSLVSRAESESEAWYEFAAGAFTGTEEGKKWEDDIIFSEKAKQMIRVLDQMQDSKGQAPRGRNTWQARQTGGEGDPFYRDSAGFEQGIWMTIEHGRNVFREKWGHRGCDIVAMGLTSSDAWKVEHDW